MCVCVWCQGGHWRTIHQRRELHSLQTDGCEMGNRPNSKHTHTPMLQRPSGVEMESVITQAACCSRGTKRSRNAGLVSVGVRWVLFTGVEPFERDEMTITGQGGQEVEEGELSWGGGGGGWGGGGGGGGEGGGGGGWWGGGGGVETQTSTSSHPVCERIPRSSNERSLERLIGLTERSPPVRRESPPPTPRMGRAGAFMLCTNCRSFSGRRMSQWRALHPE